MKRFLVAGGAGILVLIFGSVSQAADTKQKPSQPTPPPSRPAGAPAATTGGGLRFLPQSTGGVDANRRAAEARRAAQARNSAARTPTPQPTTPARNAPSFQGYNGYYPYGYGGYRNYYAPYGYSYAPYGTNPYVMGYDPYSGQTYLSPYAGGYSPNGYSPYGYGYSPYGYSPYAYRNPYYGNPYLGWGYPGAVFVNPGQLYGVGPIQQLMGVDQGLDSRQNVAPFANANPNAAANGNNNNANPGFANANPPRRNAVAGKAADAPPRKPAAGGKSLELAWKFITFGDARFGDLKFNEAMERYRRAVRECPTLGDAWFREGFAFAAMGKYDQAAKAMRRGLEEKPDWADSNFRLDEVYGNNAADKKERLDGMVKAAEAEPTNGDLALVVGIHLYCDGKTDQAAPFFRRAAQIQGNDDNVKPFLDKGQQ
jgi:Tfp pilus assembly protein PilF